ncbi:nuclear transport factor 2 family protein [Microlunatus flavus]|uniref:SnoaL-like domain-containing protein n=1 Tax=Microlunatus flavus TaxID=1036181 RepID=A0A1H9EPM3_9ACTN|nr:nuclear transport factor 2 family protein [Microlunatus flavus]SEQ27537.1 SnoaL-like domain-containing protein [Microlunatus flavus]
MTVTSTTPTATTPAGGPGTEVTPETERTLARLPLLWAKALDEGDASVLERLLTEDVVVDLTPATTRIGLEFPVLSGRDTVVPTMIGAVGPLDTQHLVSNVTARTRGEGWVVEAYALAQHFLPGEGPDVTRTRHALMGNTWTFEVRSTSDGPRVERFVMDCRWMEGDPSVLLAAVA